MRNILLALFFLVFVMIATAPAATLVNLANQVKGVLAVVNGGTGVSAAQGNGTKVQLSTGSTTTNDCVKFDANGNTVDAGAACSGSGTVTTTGSPASGNLSKFSGATSITNGDLSGDCTTSGTLATTCTDPSISVLKSSNAHQPNSVVFFDLFGSPDIPPGSANAMDDEMNAGAGGINTGLWTWVNQGSATANYSGTGYLTMHSPADGATNVHMVEQSLPSAPYKFTAKIACNAITDASGHACDFGFRESATGKILLARIIFITGTSGVYVQAFTNATTNPTTRFTPPNLTEITQWWIRVGRSGSNLTFEVSTDGLGFDQIYTETITTSFTTAPDQVVLAVASVSGSNTTDSFVWWFRRTT